jgi:Protein of unknown function (DUF2470)
MAAPNGDAAPRERIMSHMNANHRREMAHYLRHYCGVSSSSAVDPRMTDISLKSMRIAARGKEYNVLFDPPLGSMSEIRPRVVEMDAVARRHLGISDVYITAFAPPRPFDIVVACGVALYFICFFTLPLVRRDTSIWTVLETVFPGGPLWYRWVVSTIFIPVLGIHATEAWWFHRRRLVPHGVVPGSTLWWKWEVSTFFEGVCAFNRIDNIISEKRKEKEARSH